MEKLTSESAMSPPKRLPMRSTSRIGAAADAATGSELILRGDQLALAERRGKESRGPEEHHHDHREPEEEHADHLRVDQRAAEHPALDGCDGVAQELRHEG